MSSWTEGEVLQLKTHGNDYARRTWLARAPPPGTGGRPREGDHIDVFKAFVVDVYERKKYYGDEGGGNAASFELAPAPAPASQSFQQPAQRWQSPAPAPPPAPEPAVDLFSFDAPATAPVAGHPQATITFDPFGNSTPSAPAPILSLAPAPAPVSFDPFGNSGATAAPAPANLSFGFMNQPASQPAPVMRNNLSRNVVSDAFAGMGGSGRGVPGQQPMGSMMATNNTAMMGGSTSQKRVIQQSTIVQQQRQQFQGMGNAMGSGFGAHAGMNPGAMMNGGGFGGSQPMNNATQFSQNNTPMNFTRHATGSSISLNFDPSAANKQASNDPFDGLSQF